MNDLDYFELQRRYGGLYVARRDTEVLAATRTYDELADWLHQHRALWNEITVELVPRSDVIVIY